MLVHGFLGSGSGWGEEIREGLASVGARAVPMQLPGHGPAGEAPSGRAFRLEDALEAIAAVADPPFHLVGYSMGGRLALHFAARYPERLASLTLESASPGLERARQRAERRASDELLAVRLLEEGVDAFVTEWERRPLFRGEGRSARALEREWRVRRAHRPEALAAVLRGWGTGSLPSLWDRLEGISIPTLLVVGQHDPKFVAVARRMGALLPRARTVVVPGAAHTVHLDRPSAWLDAVRAHVAAPAV